MSYGTSSFQAAASLMPLLTIRKESVRDEVKGGVVITAAITASIPEVRTSTTDLRAISFHHVAKAILRSSRPKCR